MVLLQVYGRMVIVSVVRSGRVHGSQSRICRDVSSSLEPIGTGGLHMHSAGQGPLRRFGTCPDRTVEEKLRS